MDIKRQDLFSFIRRTMYYGDMYSLHLEKHFPSSLRVVGVTLQLILEIFQYFVVIHIMILYMCTIYMNYDKGDLDLLVICLMQTNVYWWAIFMKIYFRRLRSKALEDLIDFMNLKYKTHSEIGFTYVTMEDSLVMSNKWIKIFVYCCFIGCIFWIIVPISYGDRSLPLACWYPFDYKRPVIYEIMYFLQSVAQIQVAAAFSASSGFHMVLAILISGQYDILCCSLKNILATVAIEMNVTNSELRKLYRQQEFTKSEVNEFYCSKEIAYKIDTLILRTTKKSSRKAIRKSNNQKRSSTTKPQNFHFQFRNALKKCVDHHRYILECLNKMESFYSPIWFLKTAQVLFAVTLMTFVSVKSTKARTSYMEMITLGQYLFLDSWELLIISYFGEIVNANSQRCGEALMRSPWYIHMREMKYDFLFFMLNSKRSFKLTAGKMYVINTEHLRAMIKTAFSFLTLLQKMDERNN
ncbi:odorant receptor 83a-like [Cochliomyia hominivorax]